MGLTGLQPGTSALPGALQAPPCTSRRASRGSLQTTCALTVRPYTVRLGDTLKSIAEKRDVTQQELLQLNHGVDPDKLKEGQTLVLPAGKLSARDREILQGIGKGSYRTYPVRAGETLEQITSKRGITLAEAAALNPDVNLEKLGEGQIIKLPAGKYTVREREMLTGVAGAPSEYFKAGSPFSNSIIAALLLGTLYSFWLFKQREPEED